MSPDEFAQLLKDAVPSAVVHAIVEYVHDWARYFEQCIYDNVTGVTTAREFIIRERDDSGACLSLAPRPPPRARLAPASCFVYSSLLLSHIRCACLL